MTKISGRIIVDSSADACAHYLAAFMSNRRGPSADSVRLDIGVPLADLAIRRNVVATLTPRTVGAPTDKILYDIHWQPEDGGPYPAFAGALSVSDAGDERCLLELRGSYNPPAGLIGQAFDAAMGRRIATATLRALLDTLKGEVETSRRRELDVRLDAFTRRFGMPNE